jgi:hypothetical protein
LRALVLRGLGKLFGGIVVGVAALFLRPKQSYYIVIAAHLRIPFLSL